MNSFSDQYEVKKSFVENLDFSGGRGAYVYCTSCRTVAGIELPNSHLHISSCSILDVQPTFAKILRTWRLIMDVLVLRYSHNTPPEIRSRNLSDSSTTMVNPSASGSENTSNESVCAEGTSTEMNPIRQIAVETMSLQRALTVETPAENLPPDALNVGPFARVERGYADGPSAPKAQMVHFDASFEDFSNYTVTEREAAREMNEFLDQLLARDRAQQDIARASEAVSEDVSEVASDIVSPWVADALPLIEYPAAAPAADDTGFDTVDDIDADDEKKFPQL